MRTHAEAVQEQFDPQARAYLTSAVHAAGPDLQSARERAARVLRAGARVLDVGCGAGHLSFALAPLAAGIVALDPSPGMLATVREAAAARGLPQIETCAGSSNALPFAAATFDLVATRYSAHHWGDLPGALQEMRRVVKPEGHVLIIDLLGDADALVDTHLQCIELLRDASHVRDRSIAEWHALLRRGGFGDIEHNLWNTRLQFAPWVARMRTPQALVTAIRLLQTGAPAEVQRALHIEADGSFTAQTGLFWARPLAPNG
ncbi:MAG TPA: methyltransferase domain-containing protein [Steroidobacteraceae bacterium]|nr:methyltransferase domain-containing protein [Steroidobacteraceae bacterium]